MPSTPFCGTWISAVIVNERPRNGGALPPGIPEISPVYMNSLLPAVALGRGVSVRTNARLSSGKTWYFLASQPALPPPNVCANTGDADGKVCAV
jgi:hypothetical protein